jgi:hypothetical protein
MQIPHSVNFPAVATDCVLIIDVSLIPGRNFVFCCDMYDDAFLPKHRNASPCSRDVVLIDSTRPRMSSHVMSCHDVREFSLEISL